MKKFGMALCGMVFFAGMNALPARAEVVQEDEKTPVTIQQLCQAAKEGSITVKYKGSQKKVAVWFAPACGKHAVHWGRRPNASSPRFLIKLDPKVATHVDYGNGNQGFGRIARATEHESKQITREGVIYAFGGHIDLVADPELLFGDAAPVTDGQPAAAETVVPAEEKVGKKTSSSTFDALIKSMSKEKGDDEPSFSKPGHVVRKKK